MSDLFTGGNHKVFTKTIGGSALISFVITRFNPVTRQWGLKSVVSVGKVVLNVP